MLCSCALALVCMLPGGTAAADVSTGEPHLLPLPKTYSFSGGTFAGAAEIPFNLPRDGSLSEATIRLALSNRLTLSGSPLASPPESGMRLLIGDPDIENVSSEAYRLTIDKAAITIVGRTGDGILMGVRTLAQLALDGHIPQGEIVDWPDTESRMAHLCYSLVRETMAYNVPNFDALIEHIDRLAALKYNAVVLELAAMFPYRKHSALSCDIAFTPEQIVAIRERLKVSHLEAIPLIQSLGHVYYVLTQDDYKHYRETPDRIQQYCPTNPGIVDLYLEFVDEWLAVFPDIERIHIGGDESRQLGQCPRCSAKEKKLGTGRLYADHIRAIIEGVHQRGLTPLLWSDGLQKMPAAMDYIPKYTEIVYWNYDLPNWPLPYYVRELQEAGFPVSAAPGVRFGHSGTELSVYYPEALRGIETFIPRAHADGVLDILVTNWMKGSPYENTDYGFAYAADFCWNIAVSRESFNRRYARVTFGLDDPKICEVYQLLSLRLPYAEAVQEHMPDWLNRLDISGLRFPEKWKRYTDSEHEKTVLGQLYDAVAAAGEAQDILRELVSQSTRGKRQLDLLSMSAGCIAAKARFGLLLHEGRTIQAGTGTGVDALRWCAHQAAAIGAWKAAKERHHALLLASGFKPAVDFLNELMFENAERAYLEYLGADIASRIKPGKRPSEVTIPYLDNRGTPYERGFQHGMVFRDDIQEAVEFWAGRWIHDPSPYRVELKNKMFSYVSERFPFMIEELRGIADGANMTLDEIWWYNIFNAVGRIPETQSCSNVILKADDGTLHFGKTFDIDPDQRATMLLRRVRDGEHDFYVIGWKGNIWVEAAFTAAGLAIGQNSAPEHPRQSGNGIGQHFGAYSILFDAERVGEAVAEFAKIDFAGKGLVYGIADTYGDAVILEKTGTAQGVLPLNDARGIVGTNDYQSPELAPFNRPNCESCERRRDRFASWLPAATDKPITALSDLLAAPPFCRPSTEAAAIMSPARKELLVSGLPPSERIWLKWDFSE